MKIFEDSVLEALAAFWRRLSLAYTLMSAACQPRISDNLSSVSLRPADAMEAVALELRKARSAMLDLDLLLGGIPADVAAAGERALSRYSEAVTAYELYSAAPVPTGLDAAELAFWSEVEMASAALSAVDAGKLGPVESMRAMRYHVAALDRAHAGLSRHARSKAAAGSRPYAGRARDVLRAALLERAGALLRSAA